MHSEKMYDSVREKGQRSGGDDQLATNYDYKGGESETILLFLKSGHVMQSRPDERFEMVIVPQKGQGVMSIEGMKEVELRLEKLYYERSGRKFLIKNTGDIPLQLLVTLIRVESVANLLKAAMSL